MELFTRGILGTFYTGIGTKELSEEVCGDEYWLSYQPPCSLQDTRDLSLYNYVAGGLKTSSARH